MTAIKPQSEIPLLLGTLKEIFRAQGLRYTDIANWPASA